MMVTKAAKKNLIVLVGIIAVVALYYWYGHLQRTAEANRQASANHTRMEAEVRELIDRLKVAPEMIHMDFGAMRDIVVLRKLGFEKLGVRRGYPYANQVRPGSNMWMPSDSNSPSADVAGQLDPAGSGLEANLFFKTEWYDVNSSLEYFWLNDVPHACITISWAFNNPGSQLHDYLKQHMDLYRKEIRPRLLLIAETHNDRLALKACEALAAAGDRSECLRNRLVAMIMPRSYYMHPAVKLMEKCGWPVPDPWPTMASLIAYGGTRGANSSGNPKGQELPAGALTKIGQISLRHGGDVKCVAFSRDGKLLASGGADGRARVWDVSAGTLAAERTFDGWVTKVAFGPDGTIVAWTGEGIRLWNPRDDSVMLTLTPGEKESYGNMAVSPDGKLLAVNDGSGRCVQVYQLPSGKPATRIDGLGDPNTFGPMSNMIFLADNRTILCQRPGGQFSLLDANDGTWADRGLPQGYSSYIRLARLADGGFVITEEKMVGFYSQIGTRQRGGLMPAGTNLLVADNGRLLVFAGEGGIRLCDAGTLEPAGATISAEAGSVALSPDGKLLATCSVSAIRLWDTATGRELHAQSPLRSTPQMLQDVGDGRTLYFMVETAKYSREHELYKLDVETEEMARVNLAGPDKIQAAAVSGDGKLLATYGKYGAEPRDDPKRRPSPLYRLMLWNLQTGEPVDQIAPAHSIEWMRFDPYHPRLIAQDGETRYHGKGRICVYDLTNRQLLYRVAAAISLPVFVGIRDRNYIDKWAGGTVLLGLQDGRLKAWCEQWDMQALDFNRLVECRAFALSGHSKRVVTLSGSEGRSGGRLRIWEPRGLDRDRIPEDEEIWPKILGVHKLQMSEPGNDPWSFKAVAFSPNDEFLLTSTTSGNGDIVVWQVEGRPLGRLTGHCGPVTEIRFFGNRLVTASEDATLLIWDWPRIADWCRRQNASAVTPRTTQPDAGKS